MITKDNSLQLVYIKKTDNSTENKNEPRIWTEKGREMDQKHKNDRQHAHKS